MSAVSQFDRRKAMPVTAAPAQSLPLIKEVVLDVSRRSARGHGTISAARKPLAALKTTLGAHQAAGATPMLVAGYRWQRRRRRPPDQASDDGFRLGALRLWRAPTPARTCSSTTDRAPRRGCLRADSVSRRGRRRRIAVPSPSWPNQYLRSMARRTVIDATIRHRFREQDEACSPANGRQPRLAIVDCRRTSSALVEIYRKLANAGVHPALALAADAALSMQCQRCLEAVEVPLHIERELSSRARTQPPRHWRTTCWCSSRRSICVR